MLYATRLGVALLQAARVGHSVAQAGNLRRPERGGYLPLLVLAGLWVVDGVRLALIQCELGEADVVLLHVAGQREVRHLQIAAAQELLHGVVVLLPLRQLGLDFGDLLFQVADEGGVCARRRTAGNGGSAVDNGGNGRRRAASLLLLLLLFLLQFAAQVAQPTFQQHAGILVRNGLLGDVTTHILHVVEYGTGAATGAEVGVEAVGRCGVGAGLGQERDDVGLAVVGTPRHVAQTGRTDVVGRRYHAAATEVERRPRAVVARAELGVNVVLPRRSELVTTAVALPSEVVGHRCCDEALLLQLAGHAAELVGAAHRHQVLQLWLLLLTR